MMIRETKALYNQLSGCDLNLFTDDELAEIHRATLDILQNARHRQDTALPSRRSNKGEMG